MIYVDLTEGEHTRHQLSRNLPVTAVPTGALVLYQRTLVGEGHIGGYLAPVLQGCVGRGDEGADCTVA